MANTIYILFGIQPPVKDWHVKVNIFICLLVQLKHLGTASNGQRQGACNTSSTTNL